MSGNEKVREEMKTFLKALDSYPARFAANPRITFEEHRGTLKMVAQAISESASPKFAGKN